MTSERLVRTRSARTDHAAVVVDAIKVREEQRALLQQELDGLNPEPQMSLAMQHKIEALARAKVLTLRKTLRSNVTVGRQVLHRLLCGQPLILMQDAGRAEGLPHDRRWQHLGNAQDRAAAWVLSGGVPTGICCVARCFGGVGSTSSLRGESTVPVGSSG
jgi:hypothetical protein